MKSGKATVDGRSGGSRGRGAELGVCCPPRQTVAGPCRMAGL